MAELELPTQDATEQDLIQTAQHALSRCNWIVGKCAAEWTQRYARGRTDADFAQLVGLSPDQVYQRRRVWETFGDVYQDYLSLRWSHFYSAVNWDDAPECLQWADENSATVAEMRAWRRAQRGGDLEEAETKDESPLADDPSIGKWAAIPADVRSPSEEAQERRSGERRDGSDDESVPFVPGAVSSANRETQPGDADYAPFRKDAGSPAPSESDESQPAEEKPIGQIAKRVIATVERMVGVLAPQVVAGFRRLPEKDRQRLAQAVRALADRLTVLESQTTH